MRIGKRLFPYPVLNNTKLYSQYKTSSFSLSYNEVITDDYFVLDNLKCEYDSDYLHNLVDEGKAEVVLIVESAQTMFREHYVIDEAINSIEIPLSEINGKVDVSLFIVAKEDIPGFGCADFLDDYSDFEFTIEKNDIIAIDDGFTSRIDFNEEEDNKKSSIFLIVKDTSITDETMRVENTTDKIMIYLPTEQWNQYDKTKRIKQYQNLYFSMIAIPALSYALSELRKGDIQSVDNLKMDWKWFNSFAKAYENVNGQELDDESFLTMNPYVETQKLLNTPVTKGIGDIFTMTITMGGVDDGNQY